MKSDGMDIVFLGLSLTSSWGNGHATTYRGLVRELSALGHRVLFLERDKPWYAAHRDLPRPPFGRTELYGGLGELRARFAREVAGAHAVIVGSFVPDGVEVGEWVQETANGLAVFYDIDTPVTLAKLERGDHEYLHPRLVPGYRLYLSFTGGPTLSRLEREFGSPRARALYCSFDPGLYFPEERECRWELGYLGTYSTDRQPVLESLLLEPARRLPRSRMAVAGPQYPPEIRWPPNVERIEHLPPGRHRAFYGGQRFTLNVTREDMKRAGYSPSVRLFEAAACGVPIISDRWNGLEEIFLPGREILVASRPEDVTALLRDLPEAERRSIGARARERVLGAHTAAHRARELDGHIRAAASAPSAREAESAQGPGRESGAPGATEPPAGEAKRLPRQAPAPAPLGL